MNAGLLAEMLTGISTPSATVTSSTTATAAGTPDASLFADILADTAQQPVMAEQALPERGEGQTLQVQSPELNELLASLAATIVAGGAVVPQSQPLPLPQEEQRKDDNQEPQNVACSVAGAQLLQLQASGRMPVMELPSGQVSETSKTPVAGVDRIGQTVVVQAAPVAPANQAAQANPLPVLRQVEEQPVASLPAAATAGMAASAAEHPLQTLSVHPAEKHISEHDMAALMAHEQKAVAMTSAPVSQDHAARAVANHVDVSTSTVTAQPPQASQVAAAVASVAQAEPTVSTGPSLPPSASPQAVAVSEWLQAGLKPVAASDVHRSTVAQVASASTPGQLLGVGMPLVDPATQPIAAGSTEPVEGVEKAIPRSATAAARPVLDAYFQMPLRQASSMNVIDVAEPEAAPVQIAGAGKEVASFRHHAGVTAPQGEVLSAALQEQRTSMVAVTTPAEPLLDAGEAVPVGRDAVTAGEASQAEQETGGQKMDGQLQPHLAHQTRSAAASSASVASAPLETARQELSEHVVNQVREHLANRELKAGTEQVHIRLTPDNLGEVQLSLRMESQRLKVEVVAENPVVRDSLVKHSEALKESLARQNIAMDSFDVSGGTGNGSKGFTPREQGDWRELARQQNRPWQQAGGYGLGRKEQEVQAPLYQASTGRYSMLDVHF